MPDRRWQAETAETLLWYELCDAGLATAVARGRASVTVAELPTGMCHVSVERCDGHYVARLLPLVPTGDGDLDTWAEDAAMAFLPYLEEFVAPCGDDDLGVMLRRAADALAAIGAAVSECHLAVIALADKLGTVGHEPTKEG